MSGDEISLYVVWDDKVSYCFYCYVTISTSWNNYLLHFQIKNFI